jgi:adenine deaminase
VILNSLSDMKVESVFKQGRVIAQEGLFLGENPSPQKSKHLSKMIIKGLQPERFRIPIGGRRAKVIQLIPDQILTRLVHQEVQGKGGWLNLNPKEDLVILACVERHYGTGNIGLGLVSGFNLRRGAMASSVAHDSHNIVAIGREPEELFLAVKTIQEMKGGLVIVVNHKVKATLPLPIAGLMSDQPLETVIAQQKRLLQAVTLSGCTLKNPFMALSFLALPDIPELRITDQGVVDVNRVEIVPLFD